MGRVLASNAVSTLVDSALFVSIAFGGVLPLMPLVLGQYILKMEITMVSIPLIYLIHNKSSMKQTVEQSPN